MVWNFTNPFIGIAFIIYVVLNLRLLYRYYTNKDNENSFYQIGGVEIILFVVVVGIIAWSLRESGKSKQLKKANYLLDVKSNYNKALETFIAIKDWDKAGETIVKSPPGTQIVLLRRLQSYLPQSRIKSLFMKLGEKYANQNEHNLSAAAFSLAEMPWRAAQSFINGKNVSSAIDIINTTPIFTQDRNKATRNLAKYAFDSNHPVEAAQLLQSIGAEDEAVAVLIAAGQNASVLGNRSSSLSKANYSSSKPHTTQNQSSNQSKIPSTATQTPVPQKPVSSTISSTKSEVKTTSITDRSEITGSSPFLFVKQELDRTKEKIKEGKIGEAEDSLSTFSNLISKIPSTDSEETKQLQNDFTRTVESLKRLSDARAAFKNRKTEQAQIIYSELLENAGDLFSAEIFAEAGLAYEYEPADKELASEFFVEASRKAKTQLAAQRYKERADLLLESMNDDLPKAPSDEKLVVGKQLAINPNEKCCVCRRPIGTEGEVVQCNSCKSVAHFPHMAEWLKIKGVCPVCKQKLSMPETTKIALTE